jgi:DNA-binding PadR family transcriptional regulator
LTEQTFYMLLSLSGGAKHGYAILLEVKELSKRRVSLSTSTLYSALRRMRDRGMIESVPLDPDLPPTPGLPRKMYALTKFGRQVLEADMRRMEERLEMGREIAGDLRV